MNKEFVKEGLDEPVRKVALYCRESSDDTKKAPPIEEQIKRGQRWAKDNGYFVSFIFADDGYSGGDWKRPDWLRAVQEAKGKHYNVLWTWNQDRLARDTEQFLWFFRNLKENSIKVISDTEGEIIMDDVGGTAKHISLAMASEIFRKVTSEKVRKTFEHKKKEANKKGIKVKWGRPTKEIDLKRALELRSKGLGYKSIGKELGVNYQLVRRKLQNTRTKITHENEIIDGGSE